MESIKAHTAVIGAGASGLCAAISAARHLRKQGNHGKVIILEQAHKAGRKLLATGNGRCNLTNENLSIQSFHGDMKIADSVFSRCGFAEITDFFLSLGLLTRTDDAGRVYPYSNRSDTVLSTLLLACKKYGIEIITDFTAIDIERSVHELKIISEGNIVSASQVIIACGSKAGKGLGTGLGYRLLDKLGVPYSPLFSSLTSIEVSENIKRLKGIRVRGEVSLIADGKGIKSESGEIQFTDTALSGICVFNLSRYAGEFFRLNTVNGSSCKDISIKIDLMPEFSFTEKCAILSGRKKAFSEASAAELLSGIIDSRLAEYISGRVNAKIVNDSTIKRLANELSSMNFTPVKSDKIDNAQVTAGGVTSRSLDLNTLALKSDSRIRLCGELLDVDGDCGGYNLSFAWASGMIAGGLYRGVST